MSSTAPNLPLSDDEYERLGDLLARPALCAHSMDVAMLEGFLTALALRPAPADVASWLPAVLDKTAAATSAAADADTAADIDTAADVATIAALAQRHYLHLRQWLAEDAASFEPIYACGPEWGPAAWCEGFLLGTRREPAAWLDLVLPDWQQPFTRLGTAEGRALNTTDIETERWMNAVAPAVIAINAVWRPAAAAAAPGRRAAPKVGRNDPCTCGSGKKYKKCCGEG
jgi:uncharacterized protein